jgi:hypothetical protein
VIESIGARRVRRCYRSDMRSLAVLSLIALCASCGDATSTLDTYDGATPDTGALADATPSTDGAADATPAPDAGDAGCTQPAGPATCDETYSVPPQNLSGFSAVLAQAGPLTLTHDIGHSHDDKKGPVGLCPAKVACGARYLALVSARFETDQQDQSFTSDKPCVADYTAADPTFQQFGMCFSGGRVNIYVEVRGEDGTRITAGDGFELLTGALTLPVPDLHDKPANEFPMNQNMGGGGQRYAARATYVHPDDGALPSDTVTNMRLPGNHHVTYLLTFQVRRR